MLVLTPRLLCGAMSVACLGVQFSPPEVDAATIKHSASKSKIVTSETLQRGGWRLDIATDTFLSDVTCRLRDSKKNALYRMNAVGFRFPKDWDVSEAAYRIDGGPLRHARDDLPELIAQGVPVDRGPPGNASRGIVWVPYEMLKQAKTVTIQPHAGRSPSTRGIVELAELRNMASAHGCVSESSFVE